MGADPRDCRPDNDLANTMGLLPSSDTWLAINRHIPERVRVVMSRQHAKVFSRVLAESVDKYERAFGEIVLEATEDKNLVKLLRSFSHDPSSGLAEVLFRWTVFAGNMLAKLS
jgi:hypothetical protein